MDGGRYLTAISERQETRSSGYVSISQMGEVLATLHDYTSVGQRNSALYHPCSQPSSQIIGQPRVFMHVGKFRHRRHVRSRPMHDPKVRGK